MKTVLITIISVCVIGILLASGVVYSGAFNVATSWKDPAILHWVLETTRESSIESRSVGIEVPDLSDSKQIESGFRGFREMCAGCHTPPGGTDSPITKGLNPVPPDLGKAAEKMPARELFWATKYGIRMTGMPAWGPTHKDADLWNIVAFVKTLPKMSGGDYKALDQRIAPGHGHSEGTPDHLDGKPQATGHRDASNQHGAPDHHDNDDKKKKSAKPH